MAMELGRKVYRIFLNEKTVVRALVQEDCRAAIQHTLAYGEGQDSIGEAEMLYRLKDDDVVAVEYEEDGTLRKAIVTGRELFFPEGYNIGRDIMPIKKPRIIMCGSLDDMFEKISAGI